MNDVKSEIMVPMNEAANLAGSAKDVATKVKGEIDDLISSVKSISGKRRRLLSHDKVNIDEHALHCRRPRFSNRTVDRLRVCCRTRLKFTTPACASLRTTSCSALKLRALR